MGSNCMGAQIFSVVNTTVLYDLWLIEPADVELCILRKADMDGGLTIDF